MSILDSPHTTNVSFGISIVPKPPFRYRPKWVMYGQSGGVVRRPGRSKCSGCLS